MRALKKSDLCLIANFCYAVANAFLGFFYHSWWFITVGAYYTVLSVSRFLILKIGKNSDIGDFSSRVTGIMLVVLSFCLIGVNVLALVEERGTAFHEIIMIAIATYTFLKITIAIMGMAKAKKENLPTVRTLRNISLADAFVSVYTMQRSMLVSFPGMEADEIQLFNILTGTGVWLIVLFLGINLIGGRKVEMAKSKLVKANEKIAKAVTDGYKKIEKGVVDGYKKIEDKFVDAYLTKDGETVEEAKERLKKENR